MAQKRREPRSRYDLRLPSERNLAALLLRARAGELLTEGETNQLLSVNPHYEFRYLPSEPSLSNLAPCWRMLGRSMPILHENEAFTLVMWLDPNGFYWGVHLEGEPIREGYETTPQRAALRGANEFEWERWMRLPTEPPDYECATPSTPLCDVCGLFAESMCKYCGHKYCETTGTCHHQPHFSRSSCLFCRQDDHAFVPPHVEAKH
jgi:hypothetical protein